MSCRRFSLNARRLNQVPEGVYPYEAICIEEEALEIDLNQLQTISKLFSKELKLIETGHIILDGMHHRLEGYGKRFEWNQDEELGSSLSALVHEIRSVQSFPFLPPWKSILK